VALYVRVQRSKDLGKAKAHVNYIAFRSRETPQEERGASSRSSDHADVAKFRDNLEDHMTRHPMATKAYKMTISLSEKEFRELGLTSWKPIVREAMANLEQEWGRKLQWIAWSTWRRGIHMFTSSSRERHGTKPDGMGSCGWTSNTYRTSRKSLGRSSSGTGSARRNGTELLSGRTHLRSSEQWKWPSGL